MEGNEWWDNLTEEEFQLNFRLSRKTSISLQAELHLLENIDDETTDKNLLFCLWFLGNTKPIEEAVSLFTLETDTNRLLMEYFKKITSLGVTYLAWPDEEEAQVIEDGFEQEFGFSGVVGVLGSLHINIANTEANTAYYNPEMERHTIVLQVVSDCNLLLRDVSAGCPGGKDIETILRSSPLYEKLTNDDEYLIKNRKHLLGGTLHPQMKTLLTPYKGNNLTDRQHKFNILHHCVMFTVEQTFRCMENRFPRLTAVDNLEAPLATLLVSAICVLHNFSRVRNDGLNLYM